MTTAVLTSLVLQGAVQTPIDFQIALKKGDRITYAVGMKTPSGKAEGRMELTVTAADDKALTVSWPEITYTRNMRPHAAGSYVMSRRGRLIGKDKVPDASLFLLQMSLPDKPVAVGEPFKIEYALGDSSVSLTGKLEKVDETKGKLAYFALAGTMKTPDGGSQEIKQRSVFDMVRGAFRSSELDMAKFNMQFFFTLPDNANGP